MDEVSEKKCYTNGTNISQTVDVPNVTKSWRFRVLAKGLKTNEKLCLSGDCEQLGTWNSDKVVVLNKDERNNDLFFIDLNIPAHIAVHYRYCVCLVDESSNEILVRRWETHIEPRKIKSTCVTPPNENDIFGLSNGEVKIDPGWLSSGYMVQFKFYNNPFEFFSDAYRKLCVKITPVDSGFNSCDYNILDTDNRTLVRSPDNVITQVAVLNEANFKDQSQYGQDYRDGDFLIFNITSGSSKLKLTYIIDFYNKDEVDEKGTPSHVGYCFVMPNEINESEGELKLPIICTNKHRPAGILHGEYLAVHPNSASVCTLKKSYSSYWKQSWIGLDVGHRGNGASFKADHNIVRENTIASLNKAKENGADFVEFDVQLTKDLIPVIYHDFDVCISLKNKKTNVFNNDVLQLPLKDLTFQQLRNSKLYHVGEEPENERFHDTDLSDNQPFPLLEDFMKKIDMNLGFNIEIKWPMKEEDGKIPLAHSIDMNTYLDKILDIIFCYGGTRNIFFSCFNPEVCVMLSLKQNLYPVMFLTQGVTKKYSKLFDPRCNSIQYAIYNALNSNLLGIVVHTEDLLRDPTQIILTKDAGLVLFCWGEDNNNKQTIKNLKQLGLNGVIFDRMDRYSEKEVKESIFVAENREKMERLNKNDTSIDSCDY